MDRNADSKASIDSKVVYRPEVIAFMEDILKKYSNPDAKYFLISSDAIDGLIEYSASELIHFMKEKDNPVGIRFYK